MQKFGGDWSEDKLERVRKYLSAYTTILSNYDYHYAYIDAFAGTGYQELKASENQTSLLFPELAESEPQQFLAGSTRNALATQPPFQTYIFVEKDEGKARELESLRAEFPDREIRIENKDCNEFLQDICTRNWRKHRAVLFLDPFGMQVQWQTLEAIASTKAIDLWILFPLGVAVNRILRRDGNISDGWRRRLDEMFGTSDWYDEFYQAVRQQTLFGTEIRIQKTGDFDAIGQYFIRRLQTIFSGVVETPLYLYNSKNNPLYMLCFAAGNPRGSKTAIKIAKDILEK